MVPGNGSGAGGGGKYRVALLVQYDGNKFNGFQIQESGRTVQGEIENSLKILLKENIRITASGRTDSGVHALGQVVHFDASSRIDLKRLCISLNGIMDWDLCVKNAFRVPPDFHSRFSAFEREYLYLIYNHPLISPFAVNRAMWVKDKLDIEYIREVSRYLIGEMDFSSFCKRISLNGNMVRKINSIDVTYSNDLILYSIRANAFLHNMIRIIIGTIIDMFKNHLPPEDILKIIESKNRDFSGKTAPPYGLYLNRIFYNPPLENMEAAY